MKIFSQLIFVIMVAASTAAIAQEIDVEELARQIIEAEEQKVGRELSPYEQDEIYREVYKVELTKDIQKKLPKGKTKFICAIRNTEKFDLFADKPAKTTVVTIDDIKKDEHPLENLQEFQSLFHDAHLLREIEHTFVLDLVEVAFGTVGAWTSFVDADGWSKFFTASQVRTNGRITKNDKIYEPRADIYNLLFNPVFKEGEITRLRKQYRADHPRVSEITRVYFSCSDYR